jgi:hypothetical protein
MKKRFQDSRTPVTCFSLSRNALGVNEHGETPQIDHGFANQRARSGRLRIIQQSDSGRQNARAGWRWSFRRVGVPDMKTPMRVSPRPNSVRSMHPPSRRVSIEWEIKGQLRTLASEVLRGIERAGLWPQNGSFVNSPPRLHPWIKIAGNLRLSVAGRRLLEVSVLKRMVIKRRKISSLEVCPADRRLQYTHWFVQSYRESG